jgi:hypothetical protein
LGLQEGKQYVLEIRDLKGERKAIEEAARGLERGKVDLIFAIATSVVAAVSKSALDGIKFCYATFSAWDSHFGQRGTSKVLYVSASGALPSKRPLMSKRL